MALSQATKLSTGPCTTLDQVGPPFTVQFLFLGAYVLLDWVYAIRFEPPQNEVSRMIRVEFGQQRITLQSGSTTIVLDKTAGTATLQRKVLFWMMKPIERPLSGLVEARIHQKHRHRLQGPNVQHHARLSRGQHLATLGQGQARRVRRRGRDAQVSRRNGMMGAKSQPRPGV